MRFRALVVCLALLGEALLPGHSRADCVDYSDYLHWTGCISDHYCTSVALTGQYAYTGPSLSVIDLSDPSRPREITEVGGVQASDMKMVGSLMYVAGGEYLHILDIMDAENPHVVSSTGTGGPALGVDVVGEYAYVACGALGLRIAYVGDPESPYFIGTASTTSALRVAVADAYAYVADGSSGLRIIDISMPTAPFIVVTIPSDSWVRDVALGDHIAVIAESDSGLRVFDIHDPRHPFEIGTFGAIGPNRVRLTGSTAYLTAGSAFCVLDLTDPTQPVSLGRMKLTATINGIPDLAEEGGMVCLANDNFGFHVIDASNGVPAQSDYQILLPRTAWDIASQGQLAYLACFTELCMVDLSDPSSMRIVGGLDIPDGAEKIAVSGHLACLASRYSQLYTIDVADPTQPVFLSNLDLPCATNDVALRDGIAYVTGEDYEYETGCLTIVDLRDPANPVVLSILPTPGPLHGIALQGPYAIAMDYGAGVDVVDISDPTMPVMVGSGTRLIFGIDVIANGPFAYAADWLWDLRVIDISDPTQPAVIGGLDEGFVGTSGITMADGIVYLARDLHDIEVVDVGDPLNPQVLGNIQALGSYVWGVTVVDDRLYFLSDGRLESTPLQCPEDPTAIALSNLTGTPEALGVRLRWSVSSDAHYLGFVVLRDDRTGDGPVALNEASPVGGDGPYEYLDEAVVPGTSYEYEIAGRRLDGGRDILGPLRVRAVEAPRMMLHPPYPSPATASMALRFTLPTVRDVRITLFDVSGRMVRAWLLNDLPAGENEVIWDGRDENGRQVAAGIYMARVATAAGKETASVVIVK